MDVKLFFKVLLRFRLLVVFGATLGLALALVSFVRIDVGNGSPDVSYRKDEQWASYARVLVTQPGFRLGSSLVAPNPTTPIEVQTAAESRLPTLATIYASFVTSDAVQRVLIRNRIRGVVTATALNDPNAGILPIVSITSLATSAVDSQRLGDRAAAALAQYVDAQQRANGVPAAERIQLRVLNRAGSTELVTPRSKTLPVAVFLVVLLATVGLAFILENIKPSRPVLAEAERTRTEIRQAASS